MPAAVVRGGVDEDVAHKLERLMGGALPLTHAVRASPSSTSAVLTIAASM